MFKGGWRNYFALGLGLGTGLVGAYYLGLLLSLFIELSTYPNSPYPQIKTEDSKYDYEQAAKDSVAWSRAIKEKGKADPAPDSQKESASDNSEQHDAHDLAAQWLAAQSGSLMVRLTLWQLIIGGLGVTGLVYSLNLNRRATDAAVKTAEAVIGIERPMMIFNAATLPNFSKEIESAFTKTHPTFIVSLKNYGRSPAMLVEGSIQCRIDRTLPHSPEYTITFPLQLGKVTIPGGEYRFPHFPHREIITAVEYQEIVDEKLFVWVYGFLRYKGFMGEIHTTGFCVQWHPPRSLEGTTVTLEAAFYEYGGRHYNYAN